jgi:hypothetical protein
MGPWVMAFIYNFDAHEICGCYCLDADFPGSGHGDRIIRFLVRPDLHEGTTFRKT